MNRLHALAAAAVAVCVSSTTVIAFVKCKTPDGKLHFTDIPPAGCVVEKELRNTAPGAEEAPSEPAANAAEGSSSTGDAQAIAAKRRIERELDAAAADLARIRSDTASAPKAPAGVYVNTQDGSAKYYDKDRIDPRAAAELQAREAKAKKRIETLHEEFAAITKKLEAENGGRVPSWWTPPRCDGCP